MNRQEQQAVWDRSYVRAMNAPVPAMTDSYSPIPHSFFLDQVQNKINGESSLRITGNKIYTNLNGEKLVGFTTVQYRENEISPDPDFGLEMMLGYKNSYDKSMAAAIVAGLNVMICSNGCIGGDMLTFKRKHTGTIAEELIEQVNTGIRKMVEGFTTLTMEVDFMRNYTLTQKQKAELMGVMYFEEELVTPTQLSIIKKEMKESEHFRGNSAWDLYNNVTEALKTSHPINHIEDHINLHKFMTNVVGIPQIVEESEIITDESETQSANEPTG